MAAALLALAAPLGAAPSQALATRIPPETAAIFAVSDAEALITSGTAFLEACGATPDPSETPAVLLAVMVGLEGFDLRGIAVDGEVLTFLDANMEEIGSVIALEDPEAFAQSLVDAAMDTREAEGVTIHLLGVRGEGGEDDTIAAAVAVQGDVALIAPSAEQVEAMLSPHEAPQLAANFAMPAGVGGAAMLDLDRIVAVHRPQIDQFLTLIQMMMTQPQPDAVPTAWAAVLGMYADMVRGLVDLAAQVDLLTVTATPDAEALRVETGLEFLPGSEALATMPRHRESDLALADQLPGHAVVRLGATFDSERNAQMMASFMHWFAGALGAGARGQATIDHMAEQTLAFYRGLGEELAYGLYSPEEGFIPSTVMVMSAPDPEASHGQLVDLMGDPEMLEMMRVMYGAASSAEIAFEDLGSQTVEGRDVRHVRFQGMGQMMRTLMEEPGSGEEPVSEDFLESMDSLDYWVAHTDATVLMTAEREPSLMTRVLRDPGTPFTPPEVAGTLAEGADVLAVLHLGQALTWATSAMGDQFPPTFAQMAENLRQGELGLWASVHLRDSGLTARLVVPAHDIREIVDTLGHGQGP